MLEIITPNNYPYSDLFSVLCHLMLFLAEEEGRKKGHKTSSCIVFRCHKGKRLLVKKFYHWWELIKSIYKMVRLRVQDDSRQLVKTIANKTIPKL